MIIAAFDDHKALYRRMGVKSALLLVSPILAALAYPWILAGISAAVRPLATPLPPSAAAVLLTVFAILVCAAAVMAVAASVAFNLARDANASRRARTLAHLAFATPSLLTAVGNFAGLLHARGLVVYGWSLFWPLMAALVLFLPESHAGARPAGKRSLVIAHAVSACVIVLLFILPHLGNHLAGLWSGSTHIQVMGAVRLVYRNGIVEPLLLAFILFQIVSGLILVQRRLNAPSDLFGTLQSLTGIYVAVYFLGHVTAVLAARSGGTDTNWNWLTDHDRGILYHLGGSALVGHYWVGPIAILAHIACGLRVIALEHGVPASTARRMAGGPIALGVIASSAILAGLLGFHLVGFHLA